MKKQAVFGAAAIGFAIGALAFWPASRRLRQERDDARKALAAIGPAILVQAPNVVHSEITVDHSPRRFGEADNNDTVAPENMAENSPPADASRFNRGRQRGEFAGQDDPAVREARRQEFAERMRERSETARADFVERAGLNHAQAARVDRLIGDLNQQVGTIVNDWVSYIRDAGSYDSDFSIRFGHDLSSAIIAAYDALDAELPDSWRQQAGDIDLGRLIDPQLLQPIMELQREMGRGIMNGVPSSILGGGAGRRGSGGPGMQQRGVGEGGGRGERSERGERGNRNL